MTSDEVLKIAKNLSIPIRGYYDESGCTPQELYLFANEIACIEREECAKLCEEKAAVHKKYGEEDQEDASTDLAVIIRARK